MFIDELFSDDFYKKLALNYARHDAYCFGQFFWTHAYYPHENLELWRPISDPSEPTKTIAREFQIVSSAPDKFSRSLPLGAPPLKTNEEFLVIRAKVRPVVLIFPEIPISLNTEKEQRKVVRKRCLVAQVFSLKDTNTRQPKFSQEFVDRVRRLEYPQFMFLPEKSGLLEVDSLLRLDECQSVFTKHLQPYQWALNNDLQDLLRGQLQALFNGDSQNTYGDYREMILNS